MSEVRDLRVLHGMAISNTPSDPKQADIQLTAYRQHKDYCIYKYGFGVAYHAEQYGVDPKVSDTEQLSDSE